MTGRFFTLATLMLVAIAGPRATAQDETPAELRREITTLREQVTALESERDGLASQLEAAKARSADLAKQLQEERTRVQQLEQQLAARGNEPAQPGGEQPTNQRPTVAPSGPSTPPQADIPADPRASPASLYQALVASYGRTFDGVSLETPTQRAEYERRLNQWIDSVQQSMHGQTRWRLVMTEIQPTGRRRDASARFQVIDPVNGLPIGKSFLGTIPSRMVMKIDDPKAPQIWDVTLSLMPQPTINRDRLTGGVFDYPPLIGPMVEFGFDFDWIGMRRVQEPTEPASANPQPDEKTQP